MRRFRDKTVVVTGAAHGIGRASAVRFAAEGARVAVVDINPRGAAAVAAECSELTAGSRSYSTDVSAPGQVDALLTQLIADFGPVDVLHSNAGRLRAGTILETDFEEWQRTFQVNVTSAFLICRAVVPVMQRAGRGAIITTGSISGMLGEPALSAYTASKAALVNLTRSMAIDFAASGVRVNSVCPGWVDTGFNDPQFAHDGLTADDIADQIRRTVPMGRQGTPEEMAAAVAFFASDDAAYITGQTLLVDGGLLCHV